MWDDVVEEDAAAKPADAAAATAAPAAEGAAPDQPKAEEAEPPPPENITQGTDPKRLVCKHWVRPKFFQYNYLYDYQRNYYDDIINYMDKRNHGIPVEKPTPQTWGERALRTYLSKGYSYSTKKYSKDTTLLRHISVGAKFQRAHTKSLISRKYSKLGFNTVYL
ncbi:flightin [Vanessa tameamea]|uniref:Flightin n=1 Tax=Vanessa tameamea TaxID=334116 RepID=A0A8B8IS70_VANTA